MRSAGPLRLGVILWTSQTYGRRVLDAILECAAGRRFARITWFEVTELQKQWDSLCRQDGIIAIVDPADVVRLRELTVPLILGPRVSAPYPFPFVSTDAARTRSLGVTRLTS